MNEQTKGGRMVDPSIADKIDLMLSEKTGTDSAVVTMLSSLAEDIVFGVVSAIVVHHVSKRFIKSECGL